MASVVQICNMALAHIGAAATVTTIDPPDGSAEAAYCEMFYSQARTELLEPGNWAFSLVRLELSATTNDSATWKYAFTMPSDCVRALRVVRESTPITVFTQDAVTGHNDDRDSHPFDIEAEVLYTNQPEPVLLYVKDVTDTTKFTPTFTSALTYLLASYLAGPIIKGTDGVRIGDAMRERAYAIADTSAVASANASASDNAGSNTLYRVRA